MVERVTERSDGVTSERVTETGGLPVLHLAVKEDLGGLLRWSVR